MNKDYYSELFESERNLAFRSAIELVAPPKRWILDLVTGDWMSVIGHGYSIVDDWYVFGLWFRGEPDFEVPSAVVPVALVVPGLGVGDGLGEGEILAELVSRENQTVLAIDPSLWPVRLNQHGRIGVLTVGCSQEGDRVVYDHLFEARPPFIVTSMSIPAHLKYQYPSSSVWWRLKTRFRERFNF